MAVAQAKESQTAQSKKPLIVFRARGVSAAVFANPVTVDGKARTFHKVNIVKSYRDGEEWKETSSLGRDDVPVAITQLQRAWEYILDTEAARGKADADDENVGQ